MNIKLNQLYGSFKGGNALKIYLGDLGTHITGYWDTNFIRETRDWIINTFPEEKPIDEDFYANFRALLFFFQMIGGIGFFFLIIEPICNVIFRSDKGIISALDMRDKEVKSFIFQTILYSLFFGLGATILLYCSLLLVKLPLINIIISLFFGMSVGILIMFWRFGKKRKTKLIGILKTPFMGTKLYKTKQILVGLILSILLFSILEFGIGMNYLGLKPSIEKILWTPVCFLLLTLIFLIYGICFQLIFQEKFRKNFFGLLKTGICMFMTQILYFLIIMIILSVLGTNFYFIGIILPIMTPIVLLLSFISSITYQKSGNIITGIIINSFLIILIFTSISPLQSSIGFLDYLFSS